MAITRQVTGTCREPGKQAVLAGMGIQAHVWDLGSARALRHVHDVSL
jgi:hypothetical protein